MCERETEGGRDKNGRKQEKEETWESQYVEQNGGRIERDTR